MPAYSWRRTYEEALLATNRAQRSDRISAAEGAIHTRMAEIWVDHGRGGSLEEQDAMANALQALRVLREEAA